MPPPPSASDPTGRVFGDLPYGEHPRHRLTVMLPPGTGPFPVVVCLHGGAWRSGDSRSMNEYGRVFARMGIAAVLPNYRLTSTHPHPAQKEDVFSVLDWIQANAAAYCLDPDRVGLTGSSAGGHLAALAGLQATRITHACRIRCMAPVNGIFDFPAWVRDMPQARGEVEPLLGGTVEEKAEVLRDISPIVYVHGKAPACMALHGEADDDVPCSQSVRFVEALTMTGVEAVARIVPAMGHVAFHRQQDGSLEPLGGLAPFQRFFANHLRIRLSS